MPHATDPLAAILAFLDEIGIAHRFCALDGPTALPGIDIDRGVLCIDRAKLLHPGDVLHEAGHLAVMTPEKRAAVRGNAGTTDGRVDGEEIAAILWSYAALRRIGLAEEVVFHEQGYRGSARWHAENFRAGVHPGLPLLEWMGLALSPAKAAALGRAPFPEMVRWVR